MIEVWIDPKAITVELPGLDIAVDLGATPPCWRLLDGQTGVEMGCGEVQAADESTRAILARQLH